MKPLQFIFLFFFCANLFSQHDQLERFYPQNEIYRVNKVKSITDTAAFPLKKYYVTEYDTLGRQTGWHYTGDSIQTKYRYEQHDDTLIRYSFSEINGNPKNVYRLEKFSYNLSGKIIFYFSAQRTLTNDKYSDCEMRRFQYDANKNLVFEYEYLERFYPFKFTPDIQFVDSLFTLDYVISYEYDDNNLLLVQRRDNGKPAFLQTDSFFYDRSNRVIKIISFQKTAYVGEMIGAGIGKIDEYNYESIDSNQRVVIRIFDTWNNQRTNFKLEKKLHEIYMYVYNQDGVQIEWFIANDEADPPSLVTHNQIEYY